MNAEELLKYFEINVFPLYPDAADVPGKRVLIKIDGGPGRLHFLMLLSLPPSSRLQWQEAAPVSPSAFLSPRHTDPVSKNNPSYGNTASVIGISW